jgi:hypothetical protein
MKKELEEMCWPYCNLCGIGGGKHKRNCPQVKEHQHNYQLNPGKNYGWGDEFVCECGANKLVPKHFSQPKQFYGIDEPTYDMIFQDGRHQAIEEVKKVVEEAKNDFINKEKYMGDNEAFVDGYVEAKGDATDSFSALLQRLEEMK